MNFGLARAACMKPASEAVFYADQGKEVDARKNFPCAGGVRKNKEKYGSGGFSATVLRKRLFAALLAIAFLFLFIFARFFYIQVIRSDEMRYRALDQWTREIPVVAERGEILDRNGTVLAGNVTSYTVFVRPNAVKDKAHTADVLSEIFGNDREELYRELTTSKVSELTVAKHVEKSLADRLGEYDLPGVYYARDNTRTYPYSDMLSQVLGFTSVDNSGLTGIEKYYDKYLAGTDGEILYDTDLIGIEIEDGKTVYLPATDGLDVTLTIDKDIQLIAEEAMARVYEEYSPESAQCIVLDPDNFDILAMVNYPGFDLNDVPRDDTDLLNQLSRNNLVSDIYEPGSTFKIVTAAANIEESLRGNKNAFSMNHIFSSSRTRQVDGTTIKCWSNHANGKHSNQTLAEALCNSCNPCFVDIALSLGRETFYDYLENFNFGKVTGIDFSGEAQGMLIPESAVRDCDLARIGFGQTIAVTALQLACASSAAVNGGYYYQPRLVKNISSDDGKIREEIPVTLKNRTISEEASRLLAGLLENVVENGSGNKAFIEGYKVGGKTGTAQKYENGSIASGKYVSSFLGFFPADDPRYLALVIVDEPQGAYYGSVVAAPAARQIFEGIIEVRGIDPFQ